MLLSSTSKTIDSRGAGGPNDFPVIGIGASAGGLDAFTRLLRNIPADTGYAFVLIQHLDADHPSSLSEILGRTTAMPVGEAGHDMRVEPNRVFVIPPNATLTIKNRTLELGPRPPVAAQRMPIDHFLQSLAEDCGARAVGVVLSGAGSDGAIGLSAIKQAGGVTFAQEPTTAEFPSMPNLAVFAGGVDTILAPEAIADALVRLARHPHFVAAPSADRAVPLATSDESNEIGAICKLMHDATGIDFSLYRETTVYRRVLRRLALRNVESLGEYTRLLASDPAERAALQRDLLIGVTRFFRDSESFEALKTLVFPIIVRDRPSRAVIRIWVPGCASGEEAYSILIALEEHQREHGTAHRVQLFASDISEPALAKARAGRYPEGIKADVSPERLQRHFTRVEEGYQVAKGLREQCIFSRHNLLDDPPFSKLDMISCRNVLIYLDAVQERIIPMFHYALDEQGFLMLGRSETAHFADLFAAVEPRLKIYSKKQVAKKRYEFLLRSGVLQRGTDDRRREGQSIQLGGNRDVSRDADRVLLSKYSPSGVLVDENLEVLEIRGRPVPFLELTAGKVSYHLLKLIPDTGLFLEIEKLVQRAATTDEVSRGDRIACDIGDGTGEVNVEVNPLHSRERRAYLILFEAADSPTVDGGAAVAEPPDAASRDRQVANLRRQLEAARRRLTSLVEEHETSEQENQQVTEDALSANEELQSLTEELETAKEELQSTNEELISVNRDLESRNAVLASARDFARSIVETVLVPLVVVDSDLIILHVNASFARVFRTSPSNLEGQPFYSVCAGAWDVPELRPLLGSLLSKHQAFDRFEMEPQFPEVGTRALVLSGRHIDQLDLALLTVEDVTEFKRAERAIKKSEEEHRQAEKMEAIGRLAGGIAHDFNNLLTVIIADCGFLTGMLEPAQEATEHVAEIQRAAERAAALTDQLLSFSRRKVLQPTVFDLNVVVAEFGGMLKRLLGEQIQVVIQCDPDLWRVRADAGEIGRIVMNLCLNSRDAMPDGGTLTVETGNEVLDQEGAQVHSLTAGKYVRLTIRDTGFGMDAAVRDHVFEPFFSTKESSEGGGLGLATVLGIVQQSGGGIVMDSEPGQGTRFTILLPIGDAAEVANLVKGLSDAPKGDSKVVLLAEDERGVRRAIRRILEAVGYVVMEAKDAHEALSLVEDQSIAIDVLVSDLVMPGMSGRELAERAANLRPGMKVLFVSGYTEDVAIREGATGGAAFLQKPFTPVALAHKLRDVLDSKPD